MVMILFLFVLPPLLEALQEILQNPLVGFLLTLFTGVVIPLFPWVAEQWRFKRKIVYAFDERFEPGKTAGRYFVWMIRNGGNERVIVERERNITAPTAVAHDAAIRFTFGPTARIVKQNVGSKPEELAAKNVKFTIPPPQAFALLDPFELVEKDDVLRIDFWVMGADRHEMSPLSLSPKGKIIDANAEQSKDLQIAHAFLRITFPSAILLIFISAIYVYASRAAFIYFVLLCFLFLTASLGTLTFLYSRMSRRKWF